MESEKVFNLSDKICRKIVECIHEALGDGIKEVVARNRLKTKNSVPFLKWDILNTLLCDEFDTPDCMSYIAKRGAWKLILLYDKNTGFLFSFMRESRFNSLRKDFDKRKKMHYIDILAMFLNEDLRAKALQTKLPLVFGKDKKFSDEERMHEIVHNFLIQLLEDQLLLSRHALILFDGTDYGLTSVRAVMIDTQMNIVEQENWNSYIPTDISIVADEISDSNADNGDPQHGLRFTSKSDRRKNMKNHKVEHKSEDIIKNDFLINESK